MEWKVQNILDRTSTEIWALTMQFSLSFLYIFMNVALKHTRVAFQFIYQREWLVRRIR